MDIKAKFLEMTSRTYPMGTEKETWKFLSDSGSADDLEFKKDQFDNLYHIIGESDTVFCAHLDTVGPLTSVPVRHVIDGKMIKTDGKTILGADDKAGVVIMLEMIERGVPGFYLFTVGEEKGCVGSSKLSKKIQDGKESKFDNIKKIIAFDRKGYDCVITHQMEQRCCSDEFANALIKQLDGFGFNYKLDPTGMYCDSAEFGDIISECTNLSVGYFAQHTVSESQDIEFLEKFADACCKIDWQSLPAVRDPKKVEYVDSYKKVKTDPEDITSKFHPYDVDIDKVEVSYFKDNKFNFISNISYFENEIVDITLCKARCEYELNFISDYLESLEITYTNLRWDGLILLVEHDKHETKISRNDLMKYIPELAVEELKVK